MKDALVFATGGGGVVVAMKFLLRMMGVTKDLASVELDKTIAMSGQFQERLMKRVTDLEERVAKLETELTEAASREDAMGKQLDDAAARERQIITDANLREQKLADLVEDYKARLRIAEKVAGR